MRFDELLKAMIRSFFIITTGVVVSMYVFCLLFYPNASFSLHDIGRILMMSIAGDLPYVIFLSRRELTKKQMLIRKAIHLFVLAGILLYFAHLWRWVSLGNAKEVFVFLLSVCAIYVFVCLLTGYRDKKLTNVINTRLKERYRS